MTPLPKKKHTRARTGKRKNSSSNALHLPNLVECKKCKKLKRLHIRCEACGEY